MRVLLCVFHVCASQSNGFSYQLRTFSEVSLFATDHISSMLGINRNPCEWKTHCCLENLPVFFSLDSFGIVLHMGSSESESHISGIILAASFGNQLMPTFNRNYIGYQNKKM
jgi:hypothetical protein